MIRDRPEAGGAALAGYARVVSPAATWLARPECVDPVAGGELDFLLIGRARRRGGAGGGRGPIASTRLAGIPVIAKRPVHGGLLGPLLGGLYPGPGRLIAQAHAAERLRRRGVATPRVLAIGWRRVTGPLHALGIATERIPDAVNLFHALRAAPSGRRRGIILARSAGAVRSMHDAGFVHADLNVTNLVLENAEGAPRVQVIDLERGRFRRRVGFAARAWNLARLLRSHEKWLSGDTALSDREAIRFLRCYSGADRRLSRRLRFVLRLYRGCLYPRRIVWRLFGRGAARDAG